MLCHLVSLPPPLPTVACSDLRKGPPLLLVQVNLLSSHFAKWPSWLPMSLVLQKPLLRNNTLQFVSNSGEDDPLRRGYARWRNGEPFCRFGFSLPCKFHPFTFGPFLIWAACHLSLARWKPSTGLRI